MSRRVNVKTKLIIGALLILILAVGAWELNHYSGLVTVNDNTHTASLNPSPGQYQILTISSGNLQNGKIQQIQTVAQISSSAVASPNAAAVTQTPNAIGRLNDLQSDLKSLTATLPQTTSPVEMNNANSCLLRDIGRLLDPAPAHSRNVPGC